MNHVHNNVNSSRLKLSALTSDHSLQLTLYVSPLDKKATIHQVTTRLTTSKKFPIFRSKPPATTNAYDPSL